MVAWNSIRQHVFLLHFLIFVAALRTSGEGALNAYGEHRHTTKTDSSLNRLLRMMTVKWPSAFLIPFTPYKHVCTLNRIHMQNTCSRNKYNSKGIYLHFQEFPSMLAPSFKVGCMSKASSITLAWHQLMWNQDDEAPHKVAMYIDPIGIAGKTFSGKCNPAWGNVK